MKKSIVYLLSGLMLAGSLTLVSCQDDKLSAESVLTGSLTGGEAPENAFDQWLEQNFLLPYNIRFKYRYEDIETDISYYNVPADFWGAVQMAHLLKYICIDSYDEVAGIDFTRRNFPKEFYCVGTWEFKNNGSYVLATAAGSKKVLLGGLNYMEDFKTDIQKLTKNYFKTIHHEFTHILNQSKDIPTAFRFITGTSYVADSWSEYPYNRGALARGYISNYAQEEYTEDFAEMMAIYICYPPERWEEWMTQEQYYGYAKSDVNRTEICLGCADDGISFEEGKSYTTSWSGSSTEYILTRKGVTDRESIESKLLIIRQYMQDYWNIDIDELRACIQRRSADIAAGRIDLKDLTIN